MNWMGTTRIDILTIRPVIFQVSKCDVCERTIELPSVHFLCKHSFHQRITKFVNLVDCLGGEKKECPLCSADNQSIRDIMRAQAENSNNHEFFSAQVCFVLLTFSLKIRLNASILYSRVLERTSLQMHE
jgi:hypothetical protein